MSRILRLTALALLTPIIALSLSACETHTIGSLSSYEGPNKALVSYNYTAVDKLISRAGKALNKDAPMLVGTIGDVNDVETSSTFGRTTTEQVSARLAQKGYKVTEMKLRQGISIQQGGLDPSSSGEYLLSRDVRNVSGEHKAAAAVTGTYSVGADNVAVNLRLIDMRTGSLITAYDYVIPKSADVTSMTHSGTAETRFFGKGWAY